MPSVFWQVVPVSKASVRVSHTESWELWSVDHKRGLNALLASAWSKGAEAEGANHLEGKGGKVWHGLLINCSRKTRWPFPEEVRQKCLRSESERSIQILSLSKSTNTTLWKYFTTSKSPAFRTLIMLKYVKQQMSLKYFIIISNVFGLIYYCIYVHVVFCCCRCLFLL